MEPKPLTFEEAKPLIEEKLRAPLLEERFKEYIGQLRAKAVIDIRI
jgi:peptidyl-prolyl cis-trans isomerase SurA